MRLGKRFGMVRIFSVGQGVSSFPTVVVVKGNHIVNKVPGFQVQSETAARICGFAYAPRLTHGPRVQSRVHFHHLAPRDIATPFQLALARAPRRPYGLRHGARGVGCGRRSARSRTWRVSPPTASRPPKPLHTHTQDTTARSACRLGLYPGAHRAGGALPSLPAAAGPAHPASSAAGGPVPLARPPCHSPDGRRREWTCAPP